MRLSRMSLSLVATIAAIFSVLTGVAAAPTASAASTAGRVMAVSSTYDAQVLHYTNVARAQHGLRPLRSGVCMDRYATHWTSYMASRDSFRHQGLMPILRHCHQRTAGENIARSTGAMAPARVVSLWMHSPGHRANILNKRYRYLAVDAARSVRSGQLYVTQDFSG